MTEKYILYQVLGLLIFATSFSSLATKSSWTEEEDGMLLQLITKHGTESWKTISSYMDGRNSKQCRERYISHLRPGLYKGPMSLEEKVKLDELQKELGNHWSQINVYFPNRSSLFLKNFWHANNRKITKRSYPFNHNNNSQKRQKNSYDAWNGLLDVADNYYEKENLEAR